jgi:protein gp37
VSDIEWTDQSWNPVRGCRKVSPGCKHCYAETFAERFRGVAGHPYEKGFDPRTVPEALRAPLHWRKGRRVFVNSMSDLFGEWADNDYIAAVFGVMAACPQHTFQVLTKRAERMEAWFQWVAKRGEDGRVMFPDDPPAWRIGQMLAVKARQIGRVNGYRKGTAATRWEDFDPRRQPWPLPNVHLGVSAEDQPRAEERIPHLLRCPAVVRFVSAEPLLAELDLAPWLFVDGENDWCGCGRGARAVIGNGFHRCAACGVTEPAEGSALSWVITGSESGRRPREFSEAWVRALRDQCAAAGVPFFYKQRLDEKRRKVSLPLLDGVQHAAFPEVT